MNRIDDRSIEITSDVRWIGVLDYDIRTFDIVMQTDFGTTYNSFFINADKKTIIGVAKEKFWDTYLKKLASFTDPADLQYIILNHTEPDHSGSLRNLLSLAPSATVVGSGNAIRYLEDIVNTPFKSLVVKDGDTLDLGNKTLKFLSAPNLHWPDSMFTYLIEDKVLFSCDPFGAHFCDSEIFSKLTDEYLGAFKYYFDVILKPFSKFMVKAIDKIRPLEIDYICTGHGPVHSENVFEIIERTYRYSMDYLNIVSDKTKKNVLIAYVSAYGYTKQGAETIAAGILLENKDIIVDVVDIENIDLSELDHKLTVSNGILVGSPTINQNTLLPVYKLFALINPLRDKGKLGAAFGSYGWSGEAQKIILDNMKNLKLDILEESASFKFSPEGSKDEPLKEFGRLYARRFLKQCH
jgi:flavorubredoxin